MEPSGPASPDEAIPDKPVPDELAPDGPGPDELPLDDPVPELLPEEPVPEEPPPSDPLPELLPEEPVPEEPPPGDPLLEAMQATAPVDVIDWQSLAPADPARGWTGQVTPQQEMLSFLWLHLSPTSNAAPPSRARPSPASCSAWCIGSTRSLLPHMLWQVHGTRGTAA
jgi:hypothetical protein